MSRGIEVLFAEEAAALQQSPLHHLFSIEIVTLALGKIDNGSNILDVDNVNEITEGQYITIDGIDGMHQVMHVARDTNKVTLSESVDVSVSESAVRLHVTMADSNYPLMSGGITYVPFPVRFSEINVSSDGTIDTAQLTIANASREIMYYVEKYDGMRNRMVKVKTMFERFLDQRYEVDWRGDVTVHTNPEADPTSAVVDVFKIDSYAADENAVVFSLDPAIDLSIKLPHRRYTSDSCYWRYRDPSTCGFNLEAFASRHPTVRIEQIRSCQKTLSECQFRENSENFGAFPGITGQRRVYL